MFEGIVIGIIGLVVTVIALFMPHALEFKGILAFMIGPGFLPAMFGALLAFLALLLILGERKKIKTVKSSAADSKKANGSKTSTYIILVLIFAFYVLCIGKISFTVLTFIYFSAFYAFNYKDQLFKLKKVLKVAVLSVSATFFLAYVLPSVLQIPLP